MEHQSLSQTINLISVSAQSNPENWIALLLCFTICLRSILFASLSILCLGALNKQRLLPANSSLDL